ncbi:transporter substrate-binding domain-containing protein [Spirulina sp. CS-785/01]|uniref:transporter substrate-binding domain-containing protein n=1 Tax=Spirulina sp. CS-785/01 TaxID=3021716 RepID=UPI00232D76B3|nr:transporter substrate-binding domain-containing protein [Spirulina sp. CS-785/01]MDB9311633.1 transporter substrate-binding domain-containing protein [Spirulina sp. CS-785/01]
MFNRRAVIQFLLLSLATLLSLVLFAGCGNKTLIMGTSADYPPYEFKEQSGEIVGFDIDIAQAIAEELGFQLEIQDMDFNSLLPALEAGKVDFVMAGMSPTPERQEIADFTQLYYKAESIVLARKGNILETPEALSGKKIGVQAGSIQAEAAGKIEGVELMEMDKIGEIIQGVKEQTLDAAVIESTVAQQYVQANPDLDFSVNFETDSSGSAIALPKNSSYTDSFNQVLEQMKENGKIEELIQKWFS